MERCIWPFEVDIELSDTIAQPEDANIIIIILLMQALGYSGSFCTQLLSNEKETTKVSRFIS